MTALPPPLPEVHLASLSYTFMHWLPMERDEDRDPFDLEAPYQRGSVWSTEQRRNLIKSLMQGLPIGNIIVANLISVRSIHPHPYRIVDGKQRIETARSWRAGELDVPGWWFQEEDLLDPRLRAGYVNWSDLSRKGANGFLMGSSMPALEFNPTQEFLGFKLVPNPRNPQEQIRSPQWRRRSTEEILKAEAELFLLINFGGVPQTDEDRARVEEIAK